jgi:tetratricopeptide (TPR) repeat protein
VVPSTGQTLGHYRLLGLIGRGGMGQVFRGHDTRLRRDVAIKILHGDATGDEGARRRLLREARAAAALSHPSIVTVYSVEEVADRCFIVMELVDGLTLADRLATGALDLSEVCEIGAQVADALAAAHAMRIVHHDVTPRNILLTAGGRAKLADFGLSRAVEPQHISLESTRTGPQMAGTVYYMSPEQARGEVCTSRTDLFSLGSVLYHAGTGRRPFEGNNYFAILDAITRIQPPQPSAIRAALPPAFDALVGRLLEKHVEHRTIDALEVARALRSLATSGRAIADAVHATSREATPFVGRARELTRLSAALSRAAAGEGMTIAITGDAGMGKTALLDAFLHARETLAMNALVCRGQSVEYSGAGEAYMPVIDALAPMVAHPGHGLHEIVRTHAPTWRSQFPGVYPSEETASTPRTPARLARELGDALSAAARSRPVVLILEDVHWADPSTAELLRHLAHRATRAALLIIVTCRAEEAAVARSPISQVLADLEARGVCDTIELTRLDEGSVRDYLKRRFGLGDFLTPLASLLSKATEGQPLFLTSLVQLLIERSDLRRVGDEWRLATPAERLHLAIPRTVQAVIRRKLAALEEADRRLLQHASIEGQEFSTAVLSGLVGTDSATLEERLDVMARGSRIVTSVGPEQYPDGRWGARYQFAHALYQNVVYDDVSPTRRADLHRQVAERLAALHSGRTAPIAAQLARHFKDGRNWDPAFEYYVQAGDYSMTLSAGREAEGHYSEAIALANAEGTPIEPNRIARAHHKRAITRVLLRNYLAALTDCEQALNAASKTGDEDLLFDVRLNTAHTQLIAERIDEGIRTALDAERSAEPPNGLKRLRYLHLDVQLKMGLGDLGQAALLGDSAVTLARSLGDIERLLTSLGVRAQLYYHHAEYESALPYLREVCSRGGDKRRLADPRPMYTYLGSTVYLGLTLGELGHVSEGLATLQSALEIARSDGYVFWVPHLLSASGWIYGEIGALGDALQHAENAAAEAGNQDTETRVESRLTLALAYLRVRQFDRAASLLAEAEILTREKFGFAWLCRIHYATTAAEDALARGALVRATELAREGNALSLRYGVWKHVVLAERLLAEAAAAEHDWSRARAHIQQAIDTLTEHPVPILAWKVHAIAARIHRHRGLDAEAAAALEQARDQVRQLSDRIQEEQLKATFLDSFRRFVGDSW